jgi:uncharacterized membrane protein YqjE
MAERERSAGDLRHEGFFRSLKTWLAALGSALHTRLELFVSELEEERERLKQTLLLTLLIFFGFSLGFVLLNIFLIALFWEAGWIYAIGALAGLYLGIGVTAGLVLRNRILMRPRLFEASLAELVKDCDRLRSSSRE